MSKYIIGLIALVIFVSSLNADSRVSYKCNEIGYISFYSSSEDMSKSNLMSIMQEIKGDTITGVAFMSNKSGGRYIYFTSLYMSDIVIKVQASFIGDGMLKAYPYEISTDSEIGTITCYLTPSPSQTKLDLK